MDRSWKNQQIELTVTTVMGTSFKVRMSPQETILDIKRRIYFREGIPVEKQHLIWKSVELEDKVKIADYKLTSGATLQLVTAMRGGPLNIRRVPAVDDSQWLRMHFPTGDEMTAGSQGGRPVAVIVLQDGTELHFFQFIDSDDESSQNDDNSDVESEIKSADKAPCFLAVAELLVTMCSDVESEIKSTDEPGVRQRKELNARTRATMTSLRHRMQQTAQNKKAVKSAGSSRRSPAKSKSPPVLKQSPPTINRGSGTKLQAAGAANIPIVIGRSAINATRSSTLQNNEVKKAEGSGVHISSSSKRQNGGSSEHQNRNDNLQVNSSLIDQASSSSIWARLLVSSSKLSDLERSRASLRAANQTAVPAADDNDRALTDESSFSPIWLRRVQGQDEVSRTNSGRLVAHDSKHSTHSSTIVKGRANKNTAASGVISRQSPPVMTDRCSYCSKKLRLAGNFQCRCGGTFCSLHRHAEAHHCQYDYKNKGRQILEKDNPKVVAKKFEKI